MGWGFAETDARVERRKQEIQPEVWSRQGQHQEEEIGNVQEALVSKAKGWLAKVGKGSIGMKRPRAENRAWDRNNQTHWRESLEVKV